MLIFPLPFIPAVERISTAQLVFDVSGSPGSPAFNGDLWADRTLQPSEHDH